MLMRSNNSKDDKDWLAIGQKEYRETNPFGYKDYKETFDNGHWWKTVEYTDEKGEKIEKDINPLGQVLIRKNVIIKDDNVKKEEIKLDEDILAEWDFSDNQQKTKYDWDYTPEPEPDESNLSENDFYKMDWKKAQYQIYRLLLNISSSLSDIKEVPKENEK